jgi:hypothetical protein
MNHQEDLRQIDFTISKFFSSFDNRNSRTPSIGEITDLFLDSSVIAKSTASSFEIYNPTQFAEPRVALLTHGELTEFHEWETSASTEIHGPMAFRRSTYAKEGIWSTKPYSGGGTKFFQLIKLDGSWRILSATWIDDDA